jgi:hypothetical protein
MYVIQHCFICRPSDSTVSVDRAQDYCDFGIDSSNHLVRSLPVDEIFKNHILRIYTPKPLKGQKPSATFI